MVGQDAEGMGVGNLGQMPEPAVRDGIRFRQLVPDDLSAVATLAQALDDQWMPPGLLKQALKTETSRAGLREILNPIVRAEYLRSLVCSSQVVINRAYTYNSQAVRQDYVRSAPASERNAFIELLKSGAIVVSLHNERTPAEASVQIPDAALDEWRGICREVAVPCVRLAWPETVTRLDGTTDESDEDNADLIAQSLERRFRRFVYDASAGKPEVYERQLGLTAGGGVEFIAHLTTIQAWANEIQQQTGSPRVTRTMLYQNFVCPRTPNEQDARDFVLSGRYDPRRPFVSEVKQLFDLAYNTVLPDVLHRFILTPSRSLPRTALQEDEYLGLSPETINADTVRQLAQNAAFAAAQGQEGDRGALASFGRLSLEQVVQIRQQGEWAEYIASLEQLIGVGSMAHPDLYKDYLAQVHLRYDRLLHAIGRIIAGTPAATARAAWDPNTEMVLEVAGLQVAFVYDGQGGYGYRLSDWDAEPRRGNTKVPLTLSLVRRHRDGEGGADLESRQDFWRGSTTQARGLWQDIKHSLRELRSKSGVNFQPIGGPMQGKAPARSRQNA